MADLAQLLTALAALVAAIGSVLGLLISIGNRGAIQEVKKQTNGLMAHAEAEATAKGVATGHAAGVASGVKAGVRQGLDQAAADRSREI